MEGESDGAVLDPFPVDPVDPVGELSLQNRPSIFVHRRGGLETYLSKPPCLSSKNDTLKSRGFVETKRLSSHHSVVMVDLVNMVKMVIMVNTWSMIST